MAVEDFVAAANAQDGSVRPDHILRPLNCHEAVLGWLFMSINQAFRELHEGVPRAWSVVRALANSFGVAPGHLVQVRQLTANWFINVLYNPGSNRVRRPFTNDTFSVGDVIFFDGRMPQHSMVVVQRPALARGFNNASTFGGPPMRWDPVLRNLAVATSWTADDKFRANNSPWDVHRIDYPTIFNRIQAVPIPAI